MKKRLMFFTVVAMILSASPLSAGGRQVQVVMKDGNTITGELLSVRKDALIVGLDNWRPPFLGDEDRVILVRTDSVQVVWMRGTSHVAAGVLGGLGVGILIGVLLAPTPNKTSSGSGTVTTNFLALRSGE